MNRVRGGELIIYTVEQVFFVPFIVHHRKLWGIEKPSGIEPIRRDEIPPLRSPITHIEPDIGSPKGSIRRCYHAMGRSHALAGPGCYIDNQAGLATVFCRRRTRDDLHRLN